MQFTFFTDFERNIDQMVMSIVNSMTENVMTYFSPIISVGLTISTSWFFVMVIYGSEDTPALEALKKYINIAIVVFFAGAGGLYQRELVEVILALPSELATALVGGNAGMNILDVAATQSVSKAGELFELVGYTPESWLNVILAITLLISSAFLIGSTAVFFFISKVVTSVLAGLGFIFIFSILWQPVRNFFNAWANQIVHYALMLILSSLFFGFLMGMYSKLIEGFKIGASNMLGTTFAVALFSFIGYKLLQEIPRLCHALSNGIALGSFSRTTSKPTGNPQRGDSGNKGGGSNGGGGGGGNAPFRGKA